VEYLRRGMMEMGRRGEWEKKKFFNTIIYSPSPILPLSFSATFLLMENK